MIVASALAGVTDILLGGATRAAAGDASAGAQAAAALLKRHRAVIDACRLPAARAPAPAGERSTRPCASTATSAARWRRSASCRRARPTCWWPAASGSRARSWRPCCRADAGRASWTRWSSSSPTDATAAPRPTSTRRGGSRARVLMPLARPRRHPGGARVLRALARRSDRDARPRRHRPHRHPPGALARRVRGRALEGRHRHPHRGSARRARRARHPGPAPPRGRGGRVLRREGAAPARAHPARGHAHRPARALVPASPTARAPRSPRVAATRAIR